MPSVPVYSLYPNREDWFLKPYNPRFTVNFYGLTFIHNSYWICCTTRFKFIFVNKHIFPKMCTRIRYTAIIGCLRYFMTNIMLYLYRASRFDSCPFRQSYSGYDLLNTVFQMYVLTVSFGRFHFRTDFKTHEQNTYALRHVIFVSKVFPTDRFLRKFGEIKRRWKSLVKNMRSSGRSTCGGRQQRDFNASIEKTHGKTWAKLDRVCNSYPQCYRRIYRTVEIGFFRDTIF